MKYPDDFINKVICGDCLEIMKQIPDEIIQCVVTSPPYWGLRDYGNDNQIGLEKTPEEYVTKMVEVFREVKRILRKDGRAWLNLGDSYNGSGQDSGKKIGSKSQSIGRIVGDANPTKRTMVDTLKPKDLVGIPWRVAFALQADGWYLRSDIIWHKPNPMPESVTDRPTKSHEYIFLMTKSAKYYYDADAIKENIDAEPDRRLRSSTFNKVQKIGHALSSVEYVETVGRNKRSVWTVTTKPYGGAHFATYPPELITPCILAGSKEGDIVLDPFGGSGTTGYVAEKCGRKFILIELNPEYKDLADQRNCQPNLF